MVEKKEKKPTFSKQASFESKVTNVLEKQGDREDEKFVYEEDLYTGPPPAAGSKRLKFQSRPHAPSDGNQEASSLASPPPSTTGFSLLRVFTFSGASDAGTGTSTTGSQSTGQF